MRLYDYFAKDKLADISKGRYSKKQVEAIFNDIVKVVNQSTERDTFRYAALMTCQTLGYEFGFGKKRLERFIDLFSEAAKAFDAGAYSIADMEQALAEDKGIKIEIEWSESK